MLRYISETVQDSAKVTVEREYKVMCARSNGVISSDLKWPLTPVSRTRGFEYFKTVHCMLSV